MKRQFILTFFHFGHLYSDCSDGNSVVNILISKLCDIWKCVVFEFDDVFVKFEIKSEELKGANYDEYTLELFICWKNWCFCAIVQVAQPGWRVFVQVQNRKRLNQVKQLTWS